jgi:hypothetical protein
MHGDVSLVLRVGISVSNYAFKWGQSISMGEVLYSTKWVNYSALPRALLLFVPFLGASKCNTSQIREKDVTSALGAHLLVRQHNNQPKIGICSRRDIGEGAQPGWNVWDGHRTIVWGIKLSDTKKWLWS